MPSLVSDNAKVKRYRLETAVSELAQPVFGQGRRNSGHVRASPGPLSRHRPGRGPMSPSRTDRRRRPARRESARPRSPRHSANREARSAPRRWWRTRPPRTLLGRPARPPRRKGSPRNRRWIRRRAYRRGVDALRPWGHPAGVQGRSRHPDPLRSRPQARAGRGRSAAREQRAPTGRDERATLRVRVASRSRRPTSVRTARAERETRRTSPGSAGAAAPASPRASTRGPDRRGTSGRATPDGPVPRRADVPFRATRAGRPPRTRLLRPPRTSRPRRAGSHRRRNRPLNT